MISNFVLVFSFTILDSEVIDYTIPIFWNLFKKNIQLAQENEIYSGSFGSCHYFFPELLMNAETDEY